MEIDGRSVPLSNLDKVLWPSAGMTKGEMIDYYVRVAPTLLPHLRGRPLTIRRFPDGVGGPSWHQNECRGQPEWISVYEARGRRGGPLRFCMVEDTASLVWLANHVAIELHPFLWTVRAPRRPTSLVFDLDPGPPADVVDCARVALHLREVLAGLGRASVVKTTGSLGLHVHVPLGLPQDGAAAKAFARSVSARLAEDHPGDVVSEMSKSRRAGRVYVDWLQNDPGRQTVAPYSLRGVPWPTVAMPVTWEEVGDAAAGGRPETLTFLAADVPGRLERNGDLFAPTLRLEQALPAEVSLDN